MSFLFADTAELVDIDGHAWIPLETTILDDGLDAAWRAGSEQWRSNVSTRDFVPLAAAWESYPSVQPELPNRALLGVDESSLEGVVVDEIDRFAQVNVERISAALETTSASPAQSRRNEMRFAVTLARFGRLEEAEAILRRLLRQTRSQAVLINLANVCYLNGKLSDAVEFYQQAYDAGRTDLYVTQRLAICHRELGDVRQSELYAAQVAELMSDTNADADQSARAASSEETMLWEEE